MLFNSVEFLIFLPIVFLLYWFVFNKSIKAQNILILLASYFFYGWWSYKFLFLLAGSTLIDYYYGFKVNSSNRKTAKLFLWLSVINNLGILAIFKYYDFFAIQLQTVLNTAGVNCNFQLLQLVLPIGISFYTFHGMSYVFDIYRNKQTPVKSFIDYSVFVSFFPLLVAGPIERANHLLPQILKNRVFSYETAVFGCRLILWGLVKKVVIADNLSILVDDAYANYHNMGFSTLLLAVVAFSFQIYCDFSGYSDIALGTAKLFGFELLSNFRFPYFSRDIAEFWRRWHISLSSWFKDYLYIPLGGSRDGIIKSIRNTFIIFIVSGFWHGAKWNFIFWGGLHAVAFLPLLLAKRNRNHVDAVVAQNRLFPGLKELFQMLATFGFVTIAWIFFRADNLHIAVDLIKTMSIQLFVNTPEFLIAPEYIKYCILMIVLVLVDWQLRRNEREIMKMHYLVYLLFAIAVWLNFGKNNSFIYFQF